MKKNYTHLLLGVLIGLLLGLGLAKLLFVTKKEVTTIETSKNNTVPTVGSKENSRNNTNRNNSNESQNNSASEIPFKVYKILEYVKANGRAMDGYVGGRIFQNREKQLPKEDNNGNTIRYQEWDVNPKVEGKNRGAERMVTGSDGRSWYTTDHYKSFIEIK